MRSQSCPCMMERITECGVESSCAVLKSKDEMKKDDAEVERWNSGFSN